MSSMSPAADLPFTPPLRAEAGLPGSFAERLDWLRLARSRNVGPGTFRRLIARFGGASAALEALPGLAAGGGKRDYLPCEKGVAEEEMARAQAAGARMLVLGGLGYPELLGQIGDPPPVLWARGDVALAARSCIGLVGARNASSLGQRMAVALAEDLGAAKHVVVSGLARGIDSFAHRAALKSGTVAVLAGGVDTIYPEENRQLAAEIAEKGLLLSEAPMGAEPTARHFPRRNRLISGMSRGVVLIEAAERSGSLITARCALEQGREVMAVPGSPLDPRAGGCNILLKQGAALVRSIEDIEEALDLPGTSMLREPISLWVAAPAAPPAAGLPDRLAELLASAPIAEDELVRAAGVEPAQVLQALTELDLAGRVERRSGGLVALIG